MTKPQAAPSALQPKHIKGRVADYAASHPQGTFNYRQVSAAIGADTARLQRAVALALAEMAFDNDLIELAPGKYAVPRRATIAEGVFVRRSNGKNSVIVDGHDEAIFVAERNSRHALNGDRVQVEIAAHRRGAQPEAEVIDILERKEQTFIGTLKVDRHVAYVATDSKFLAADIIIPRNRLRGGKSGDKAIARITAWDDDDKNPRGEIVDILGTEGENTAEMHAILAEFGLPYSYPAAVERAAAKIDAGITPQVVAQREDLRGVTTFTIDPADAKDFDDALSFRRLANGNIEVGVHIADVTHYVRPESAIDREARERATSVYLVDRTIPMLPEHLSNGICSLRPDEDKLTFSCIFELTQAAEIVQYRIARTVTRSIRRFTYEEAQAVIESGQGDLSDELLTLNRLAMRLREQRFKQGAMEFERAEVRFQLDAQGRPVSVYFKEAKEANKLIEEFMLLANKTVAAAIGARKKPKAFVYRVHDVPDPGKLSDLANLARAFGYRVRTSGDARDINRSINKMLTQVKGRGEENFLSTLAIRAMAKAVYSTVNVGHYGLAFDYYTHFTSPIRRYPDMMVHRLLEKYLAGGRSVNAAKLEEECKHDSEMEQLAANAERASIKYKQVEFMQEHLGEEYDGVITGVTEWGLYVELNDNLCEGLVPVRDLEDDYYDYDERNFALVGRRNHKRYRLGDPIKVRVARADLRKKQLDFVPADSPVKPAPGVKEALRWSRPKAGKKPSPRQRR